ncbi:MAG: Mth938-like domain-containing protein [Burkholderiales bacterium]
MKLHASSPTSVNAFTGYGEGYVLLNGVRREASVIVLPGRVVEWAVASFAALAEEDFARIAALAPEVVLLGTGARLRFPRPALSAPLARAGIGLEVMDLQAACRTYNILAAEERIVAAALVFG